MITMTLTIEERPNGDIAVGIREPATHVTSREGHYADLIHARIKVMLAHEMPCIARAVAAKEQGN